MLRTFLGTSFVVMSATALVACGSSPRSQPEPTSASGGERALGAAVSGAAVLVNRDHRGVAIEGYDPVAYFTDHAPTPGDPEIRATHRGATYFFASEEHRWEFLRDPDHYAPAFGGYCGYAASIERLSPTSPQFWSVIGGRLVLQHNQHAFDLWNQDPEGHLARADANWPALVEANALPAHYVVNVDPRGVAIGGYDPISYFEGEPVVGVAEHAARYGGATYWFASEEHRGTFERSPARYAPAYGGFCAYATSIGLVRPVTPTIWQVHEGRLFLQHSQDAYQRFNTDVPASVARADERWPGLVLRAGL